jgi:hypothetical protein
MAARPLWQKNIETGASLPELVEEANLREGSMADRWC